MIPEFGAFRAAPQGATARLQHGSGCLPENRRPHHAPRGRGGRAPSWRRPPRNAASNPAEDLMNRARRPLTAGLVCITLLLNRLRQTQHLRPLCQSRPPRVGPLTKNRQPTPRLGDGPAATSQPRRNYQVSNHEVLATDQIHESQARTSTRRLQRPFRPDHRTAIQKRHILRRTCTYPRAMAADRHRVGAGVQGGGFSA